MKNCKYLGLIVELFSPQYVDTEDFIYEGMSCCCEELFAI